MANGLITKQTDLKSLKYSSMPLGSQSPYVTKNIGQAPGSQIGLEIQSRIDDTSRIAQMLIDKPGLKYLLNEALLQQTDIQDKLQKARDKGKTLGGAILQQVGNTAINTAKIAASTLAQVPVNGTGTHFVKGFRTDTYLQPSNGNQRSGFAQFFGAGGVEGAPLALKGQPIEGQVESNFGEKLSPTEFKVTAQSGLDYDEYLNKPIPKDSNEHKALAENGKPIPISGSSIQTTATPGVTTPQNLITGSIAIEDVVNDLPDNGVNVGKQYTAANTYTGKTAKDTIGKAVNGKKIIAHKNPAEYPYFSAVQQDFSTAGGGAAAGNVAESKGEQSIPKLTSLEDLQQGINSGSVQTVSEDVNVNTTVQDFRQGSSRLYSFDYNDPKIRREKRVNLGDQGKKKSSTFYTKYTNTDPDAIDQLNALDIQYDGRAAGTQDGRDLAKLYFEIITPDNTNGVGTFLHFRAFIDNIDDSYNADWQGFNYVGRGEKFYTYGGFERDITVGFKIAAATRSELKPLYRKMVYLASATAPTYGGQGFMRGTLARITIGSYFSQIPGVITSVKYNLIDDMPWEIAMQNPEAGTDDDVQELPMGLQCSVSFKAIHDFAPVTGLKYYMTNPNPQGNAKPFF